jgi:hypothetical protein
MNTILSILANISILAVAYAVPKVILYCYARKYNTTAEILLNYCSDFKFSIKSVNMLIIILAINCLISPAIGIAAGEAFNDMLFASAVCNLGLIITLGSLFLAYGILYIGNASKKLPKRRIKI